MSNPILDTIMIVEDRIGEILSEGRLRMEMGDDGLPTEKCTAAHAKWIKLKQLSIDLHRFYHGQL